MVPLTPRAFEWCRSAGIEHRLVDDLIDRPALHTGDEDFLRWQEGWITAFGHLVGEPEACQVAAQLLKTPLDSAVVWARVLRSVIEAVQPASLTYVGPAGEEEDDPYHHGHLQFWPKLGDLPLAARFLPLLAQEVGLSLGVERSARAAPVPATSAPPSVAASLRARFVPLRHLSRRRPLLRPARATLFTWTGGYGLRSIVRVERGQGSRILFLRRGGAATALLGLGPLGYGPIGPTISFGPPPPRRALPSGAGLLLGEIDELAGLAGAGGSVRRRLEVHAAVVLPLIRRLAAGLEPQLEEAGIERVVATNASSAEEFAVLLAARRFGVERVMYQHGDHAFSYDGWLLTETVNFDHMVATDPTVPPDLAEGACRLGLPAPTTSLGRHREPRHHRRGGDGPVCYVPATLAGDTAIVPPMYFEDAWYLRWQLLLLDEMSKRGSTQFIWKALPGSDQADDPIPDLLRERSSSNVRYETRPFLQILPDVSMVVLDFPSTALYEAVNAGVPTTCVSFPRFAFIRQRASALFDGVLHPCASEEEALVVIRRFLDAPEDRRRTLVDKARERLAFRPSGG